MSPSPETIGLMRAFVVGFPLVGVPASTEGIADTSVKTFPKAQAMEARSYALADGGAHVFTPTKNPGKPQGDSQELPENAWGKWFDEWHADDTEDDPETTDLVDVILRDRRGE